MAICYTVQRLRLGKRYHSDFRVTKLTKVQIVTILDPWLELAPHFGMSCLVLMACGSVLTKDLAALRASRLVCGPKMFPNFTNIPPLFEVLL
jgi:hypothetical protein